MIPPLIDCNAPPQSTPTTSEPSRLKPILMTAIAASASCHQGRFDLQRLLNYLKVKITGEKPDKREIGDAGMS